MKLSCAVKSHNPLNFTTIILCRKIKIFLKDPLLVGFLGILENLILAVIKTVAKKPPRRYNRDKISAALQQ